MVISDDTRDLVDFVRKGLAERADPGRGAAMAAYMRTEMPFLGVDAKTRRDVARAAARFYPPRDREAYEVAVLALWNRPHREEKYCAIALLFLLVSAF